MQNNLDGLSDLDDLSGLDNESELPHLSNAISYETDIAPYRYIQIYAGVGSGKNTFINRFVNGDPEKKIPQMIVLVITSRRSKVDELHADEETEYACCVGKWGNMTSEVYDDGDWERFRDHLRTIQCEWGNQTFYQKSVACTNAFIESYIRNVYDPSDPGTHLWNLFHMIVVDEFHSLVMDASYQTAPFYVNSLIWEIARRHHRADEKESGIISDPDNTIMRPLCKHLILMTGTPEIVKRLPVPYIQPHVLDMMNNCVNVVPKNIRFLDRKQAKDLIEQIVSQNRRCIYFMNHVLFPEEFCQGTMINPDMVAVSFSKKERRDPLAAAAKIEEEDRNDVQKKLAHIYEDMVSVEKSIAACGLIPDHYLLWLTTSRNKEGININNKDINDVFVEAHNISDIKQMAGRVRHGAENLYIIVDSFGFNGDDYPYENVLASDEFAPDARKILAGTSSAQDGSMNRHLIKLCNSKGFSNFFANANSDFCPFHGKSNLVRKCIERIHKMTDFVRFDHFLNHFCFYYLKAVANRYLENQRTKFMDADQDHTKYAKIFQASFPTSIVHQYKDRIHLMREYVELQLAGNPNREFTTEEIQHHMADLNRICFDNPNDYLDQPKRILKPIGLIVKRVCNESSKPGYRRWRYKQATLQQLAS